VRQIFIRGVLNSEIDDKLFDQVYSQTEYEIWVKIHNKIRGLLFEKTYMKIRSNLEERLICDISLRKDET